MKSLSVLIAMIFAIGCVDHDDSESEVESSEAIQQAMEVALPWDQVGRTVTDQVTFIGFKKASLEFVAVVGPIAGNNARTIELRFVPIGGNLGERYTHLAEPAWPNDIEGKCGDTAEKWVKVLSKPKWSEEKKHKHITKELLPKLARDKCTLEVTWKKGLGPLKDIVEIGFSIGEDKSKDWSDCKTKVEPEICDGKDNDCDGKIDEDLSRNCTNACGKGTEVCQTGMWVNCSAPKPRDETCNGMDDNCNGLVDEGLTRECSTGCGQGRQTCIQSDWSSCSAPLPSLEICDGKDNDCNGKSDDNASCGEGKCLNGVCRSSCTDGECAFGEECEAGFCFSKPCEPSCVAGQICVQGECAVDDCTQTGCDVNEICQNNSCIADPCRGVKCAQEMFCFDGLCRHPCSVLQCPIGYSCHNGECLAASCENGSNLGNPCAVGIGECKRTGVWQCNADLSGSECSVSPGEPTVEVCDGKDNDCDGMIDENLARICVSACGKGTQSCIQGDWTTCSAPIPSKEICDGIDNDCNGMIDDEATCKVGECIDGKCRSFLSR